MSESDANDRPNADPAERLRQSLEGQAWKAADRAVDKAGRSWWARADENQKLAVGALVAAAVVGPLGQGFLAAVKILYAPSIPSAQQLAAVLWLALLTLPVFGAAGALTYFFGRTSFPVLGILIGLAAYLGGMGLAELGTPTALGDFYCYNDGVVLEHECRAFDSLGFASRTRAYVGSPSGSTEVVKWAFVYTADARGGLMAFCGLIAGLAGGYLVRRELATD
jgi:hypothetical protein